MSGHSKWATIKHKKAAQDAKKGAVFTKLGNAITVAARLGGGDLDTNFGLRLAIEKAKAVNMPKENIERAIKRGTGELGGNIVEEAVYEGLLPGGVAVVIKTITDSKNRTLNEVKNALTKNGAQLVAQNGVLWQFDQKGVISIDQTSLQQGSQEEVELLLIDAGAEDIEKIDDSIIIYTNPLKLQQTKENLDRHNIKIESAELEFVAKEKMDIDEETKNKLEKIFDALDDLNDVVDYYTNLK